MSKYIKDYNDNHYFFKVAKSKETHDRLMDNGYNHIFVDDNSVKLYTYNGYIPLNVDKNFFNSYSEADVLSVNNPGIIQELYLANSNNNAICITLQCNSNCVMCPCSEQSRKHCKISDINYLIELLYYYPKDIEYLTITGGEPTLLKEDFFLLLNILQANFKNTCFQLLTNGRVFCNNDFNKKFNQSKPNNMQIGIPLYGYDDITHDSVTQTPGSFKQTISGIHNLLNYFNNIEIRVVLTKQTIKNLTKTTRYIIENLKGINSVKFMGLEMLGNAIVNKSVVWQPYDELFNMAEESIKLLINAGIDIALYNFPLCTVKRDYWWICEKSISDYKIEYNEECDDCNVKNMCGGIFGSTRRVTKFKCKTII